MDSERVNLADIIEVTAVGDPERAALIVGDRITTFAELRHRVAGSAKLLRQEGVSRGDRVAVVLPTGLAALSALLGSARLVAAAALMNPALGPAELRTLVDVVGGVSLTVADGDAAAGLSPRVLTSRAVEPGDGTEPAEPGHGASDPLGTSVDPTAAAFVLFTSGTTGTPKPVPVSHDSIVRRLRTYAPEVDRTTVPASRLMCTPIFHIGGLLGLLLNLWAGRTTVVQPRFDAGEWLALVEQHGVESSFLVPTMLHRIIEHPDRERRDLSSLRSLAYGAAAAPTGLVARAMAALPGVAFLNTFGQTETLGGYTALSPADHHDPARAGSVGQPLAGVEVRVVRPGSTRPVPPGEVGELLVRSEQNVGEGWLHTGDLARQDRDGYLYPAGRLSDTINRGGEKFGPAEVEEVLRQHPSVADVGVAGLPDPELNERVGAVVVVRAPVTEAELREHCRAQLAQFKVPERIVFAERLPYNDLGKLTRASLARVVAEAHGRPAPPAG